MSTNDVVVTPVVVEPNNDLCVHVNSNHVDFDVDTTFEVTGFKREYAIVGDAFFPTTSVGDTPAWMVDLINEIIDNSLNLALTDIDELKAAILESLRELDVAKNQYEELINIEATIDSIISSRLATLNANLGNANAQIIELQIAKVTAEQAAVIAIDQISAELNSPSGTLYGAITNIRTTVTNLNGELDAKYADLYDLNENTAFALSVEINRVEASIEDVAEAVIESMDLALATDVLALAQRVTDLTTDTDNAFANVNVELEALSSLTAANASAITTLNLSMTSITDVVTGHTTAINANTTAVSGINTSITTLNGLVTANANSITTLRADMDGEFALVDVQMSAVVTSVGNIGSRFGVRLVSGAVNPTGSSAPVVGGFELLNNGTLVHAGFEVDEFWIGRVGVLGKRPFFVSGGVVYIDSAVIQDAAITNAKIGSFIQSTAFSSGSTGWRIDKSGTAEFRNIVARGDIRASSLEANLTVTNAIRSSNFNVSSPATSPGWGIFDDGRAFFSGAVISRPNVIVQGTLNLPAAASWNLAHYSKVIIDGGSTTAWTTQVGDGLIRVDYGDEKLKDVEFIVDLSAADYPNADTWSTTGPLLGVSCVVTVMDNFYSGGDPGAPYARVGCSGTVERVGDLTTTSFIRIRLRVPLPDVLHSSMRGYQIRSIAWALLALR